MFVTEDRTLTWKRLKGENNRMNKKYLPSALILYLNYFLHGVGCSILGQAVIKEALAGSWNVTAMAITAISAALGLGRLIALPFAGPLSDKLGRRISCVIGGASYAIYLIGLALAFNAGTNGGYQIAYVCAILGGVANSFLDTGIYPAVGEVFYSAPGVATMGIKFFISVSQMLLPFALGATVATTASGLTSYNTLFYICGICYIVLAVLILFAPLPDSDAKKEKKEGLIQSLKTTRFSVESIAMILIGFTCTGTFQLWLNCAQNFAKEVVGWADPSIMQTYYSVGTMLALIVTALLTRKIKDVRFIMVYPVICLAALILVLVTKTQTMCLVGAFAIGWAGAGGLLVVVGRPQAQSAAHVHHALHAQVQVARLFRQDLAHGAEEEGGTVEDGGADEEDQEALIDAHAPVTSLW